MRQAKIAMISFVIPVYNCKAYLEQCLESLLQVQGSPYEILLIDDGSTDGSSALCDRLAEKHSCVRCIHQANGGVSAARNRGIEEARGEWIMLVDADDSVDRDALLKLLEEIEGDGDLDAVLFGMSFDYYRHGKNYRSELLSVPGTLRMDKAQWGEKITELHAHNYLSSACNKFLKKSILDENDLRFCTELFLLEDLEFSLRYLACCERILCSDQVIYRYRQAEDEGNAGRRLMRVSNISALVDRLDVAFTALAVSTGREPASYRPMVIGLFLMLARQKIAASDRKTISLACDDFILWVHEREIPQGELGSEFAQDLLHRRIGMLIMKRDYSRLRHGLANRVKYLRFLARGRS